MEGSYQFNESFVFSQPGDSPYQNIDSGGVTLANLNGDIRTYYLHPLPEDEEKWEEENWLKDATIKIINSKSENKSFNIFEEGSTVEPWIDQEFYTWNHWPVAQLPSDGRFTKINDRPAHTALSNGSPIWKSDGIKHTAVSIYGMNLMKMDELIELSKSWNFPCDVSCSNEALLNLGYDKYERAHVFRNEENITLDEIRFTFKATQDNPFNGGALIVENVNSNKFEISSVHDIRFTHAIENKIEGDNLVIWIPHNSKSSFTINISEY